MLLAPGSAETASPEAGGVPAGLVYSSDVEPGIARIRRGKNFAYRDSRGRWIKDEAELKRIRQLAIPPAYESVWICASPDGHLQATGRDARGRKQYRYHPTWRLERDSGKFDRLQQFAKALPGLRRKVQQHLKQQEHSRELVLATIVRLLDTTLIRVGNEEYARENGSFGLTTLRNRHARIDGDTLKLSFKGKSGVRHDVEVKDPRVLRVVRRCLHLPGQELFQYRGEDGELHSVGSGDVNDFLDSLCPERFTAKDFRTWHGSVLALDTLRRFCGAAGEGFTLKQLLAEVAQSLGNTPAVCRKAYVHPGVLELGMKLSALKGEAAFDDHVPPAKAGGNGLSAAEKRLVALLAALR
jgi:DNA topoisomerase-1